MLYQNIYILTQEAFKCMTIAIYYIIQKRISKELLKAASVVHLPFEQMPSTHSRLMSATVQPAVYIYYCKLYTAGFKCIKCNSLCHSANGWEALLWNVQYNYPFDVFVGTCLNKFRFALD